MSGPAGPERTFRHRGLGRGLDALLAATPAEGEEALLVAVDPQAVTPNPEQPRRSFDEAGIDALAESIRLHGLLHPVVVQRAERGYQLVAGERRLRAAQRAGVSTIPAIVRPEAESGRHSLEMALTENLVRTDLNPLEEAAAYARLADAFGMSHEAIALRLGRSRPTVSNAIRLLGLSPPVQEALATGRISAGHARALLALPTAPQQEALARRVETEGLSVRDTERAASGSPPPAARGRAARPETESLSADDQALRKGLEAALGLPVRLRRDRRGGGEVAIEFIDDADLDGLYRRLGAEPL